MMFNPNLDLLSIMISTVPLAGISNQRRNALWHLLSRTSFTHVSVKSAMLSATISLTEGSDCTDQVCV